MWNFFECFHEAEPQLSATTHYTQSEVFTDNYICQVLAQGLPNDFEAPEQVMSSARSNRSATPSKEQQDLHLELRLFSDLKQFFADREIDCSEVLANVKMQKSGGDSKGYYQLLYLIFTAFYIDHSQNRWLGTYFGQELQTNILSVKHALDIVQSLLSKSEITMEVPSD